MSLEHPADQLEHLVGDVRRAVGEDDGRTQFGGGGRGGIRQITGELDEVGEHAAPRRRFDFLRRVPRIAAHVELLPRVTGEGRVRPPAPARVAGHRRRRGRHEAEQTGREIGLPRDDEMATGAGQPALDAPDGLAREVRGVRNEQGTAVGEPRVGEVRFLDNVVLEIASGQEHARPARREIGMVALEPGARPSPRVGERIRLAAGRRLRRVRIPASPAEQHGDVMSSRANPLRHVSPRGQGICVGKATRDSTPILRPSGAASASSSIHLPASS